MSEKYVISDKYNVDYYLVIIKYEKFKSTFSRS